MLLVSGGAGFVLIGLAPTDVHKGLHVVGAALIMGSGNVGLVLAGFGLADRVPRPLRRVTGLLGVVALLAFGLFLSGHYLGLGMGGMERVAAYPFLFWAAALGVRGCALRAGRTRAAVPEAGAGRARAGTGPSGVSLGGSEIPPRQWAGVVAGGAGHGEGSRLGAGREWTRRRVRGGPLDP